jgi:hypothetical protein
MGWVYGLSLQKPHTKIRNKKKKKKGKERKKRRRKGRKEGRKGVMEKRRRERRIPWLLDLGPSSKGQREAGKLKSSSGRESHLLALVGSLEWLQSHSKGH